MKLWEVRPEEKKCVYLRTTYTVPSDSEVAADKIFYIEEMYRWGRCVVRSDTKPAHHEDDPYGFPFELSDYDVEDQECDDGCSLDFVYEDEDDWTEEEKAYIEGLWEDDSWSAFEENGIYADDCDTSYCGPLEVTEVGEVPDAPPPPATGGWPFGS